MACLTALKRNHDFDPLYSPSQRSPKRRRCTPMNISHSPPPISANPAKANNSPFSEVSPKLTSEQIAASISAELRRMQRRRQLHDSACSSVSPPSSPSNHFSDSNELAKSSSSDLSLGTNGASSSTNSSVFFNALSPNKKDIPLFTFKQVGLVCERMLREREDVVREQYDKVLASKLAEQYEAFLKFNHDQLQRRYNETPSSYVS